MKNYKKIFSILPQSFYKNFMLMCFFTSFMVFIEILGVSAILPLISVISDPEYAQNSKFHLFIFNIFGYFEKTQYIYYLASLTILFFIIRALLNILFFYFTSQFSFKLYKYYQYNLFNKFINSSYLHFVNKNKMGYFMKLTTRETLNISVIINSLMLIFSEIMIFLILFFILLYLNFTVTITVFIILFLVALINLKFISKKILKVGKIREASEGQIYSSLKEVFSSYKLIKFLPSIEKIEKSFKNYTNNFCDAFIKNQVLSNLPRINIETIAFIIFTFFIVIIGLGIGEKKINISSLSFFFIALVRIIPSVNRIIANHYAILYSLPSIDALKQNSDIPQDLRNLNCHDFNNVIRLKDVDFKYDDKNVVFNKINLTINKGDKIVVTGSSGTGKTTLIDLITGLLKPTGGSLIVDDVDLTSSNRKICNKDISYLDQNIFISNDTIANNVALGREKNKEKIMSAIKLSNFLSSMDDKSFFESEIGEDGSKLSGGQRQRIAIARALYANAKLCVFDEPTSSLDDDTSLTLVKNFFLKDTNKTIIVIDHRGHFENYANKVINISNQSVHVHNKF